MPNPPTRAPHAADCICSACIASLRQALDGYSQSCTCEGCVERRSAALLPLQIDEYVGPLHERVILIVGPARIPAERVAQHELHVDRDDARRLWPDSSELHLVALEVDGTARPVMVSSLDQTEDRVVVRLRDERVHPEYSFGELRVRPIAYPPHVDTSSIEAERIWRDQGYSGDALDEMVRRSIGDYAADRVRIMPDDMDIGHAWAGSDDNGDPLRNPICTCSYCVPARLTRSLYDRLLEDE